MPLPNALIRYCLIALLIGWVLPASAQAEPAAADLRQTWQMLDYIAVDYPGAVQAGRVIAPNEYAEMSEFAGAVRSQLGALPGGQNQQELTTQADRLVQAVAEKADPAQVATLARGLGTALLARYPIGAVPASPPKTSQAASIYSQQCAACHGPTGYGDGPAAQALSPPPIAFTDATRAAQRTPLSLYEVISQGVPGTGMVSFSGLSESDRWALAFYVGSLGYSSQAKAQGEALWRTSAEAHTHIPSLEALTRTREADLATTMPADQANAIIAYLRSQPQAVNEAVPGADRFAVARQRLAASQRAYADEDLAQAKKLALSSYLDGVEPLEPTLATRNPSLLREIETAMAGYRAQLDQHAPAADVAGQAAQIAQLFDRADVALQDTRIGASTAFLGSFTILVREGLEALLIVIGIVAFLRKAERSDVLPYVHAGWICALLAGAATWAVATYFVDISGANREVTEGVSALFAAAVLLSVGIWMHQKSLAGRWQEYLHAKLTTALTRRSAVFLFMLAFVAVYREVFETILFYIAMWSDQASTAILAGLVAGIAVLAAVAYWMLRMSRRLPIGRFFSISSILIAVMAVILIGKGVAALQEAGWISQTPLALPRIEWIGLYPTWQSLLAQVLVGTAAIVGFLANARSGVRRQPGANKQ
ncbi:iron permease [Stenotrophomonas sp. Betaine-02u-21]|uniref:FTR1 family protein n=1 Tax=unclassified Stenotrophomonas TaxID=196198 RepID=UPI000C32EEF4|nr:MULTISPECIES: FTR1 family protein [unclassified Stenotrophomonas]PKH73869.1 iron permease [Stenotrophomonas sp. Betaine-02u-23]PKH76009.1 iron permease [Stenotrophomonas sp. Betaine-02u-21]PKH94660.1 iron permease [Stenotrophomonas sp. Bg11-02]